MQRRKTVTMTSLVGHFVRSCAQSNGQLTKLVEHCPMTGWRYNPWPPRYSGLHHDNVENNAQEMVSHLVVLYRSPCSASRSPPSYHCPLLPITVPSFPSLSSPSYHCPLLPIHCPLLPVTVPSFPSLSPPSHHCPLLPTTVSSVPSLSPPSHHCPLLPITVSLLPILLSPPPHHCPLFPITVPSSPPLSPPPHHCPLLLLITSCYHGRLFFPHYSQGIPSSPQSGQLKRTPLEC